jgi:hypothetical protein
MFLNKGEYRGDAFCYTIVWNGLLETVIFQGHFKSNESSRLYTSPLRDWSFCCRQFMDERKKRYSFQEKETNWVGTTVLRG